MSESKSEIAGAIFAENQPENVSEAACGAWPSPLAAEQVARGALRLSQTVFDSDGETLYWLEGRPAEGGRSVLVKTSRSGQNRTTTDINSAPVNIRSLVHEYGGGAFNVDGGEVFYSNFADQRLYISDGCLTLPLSASHPGNTHRFADYTLDRKHNRVLFVMELHEAGKSEPANCIASLPVPANWQNLSQAESVPQEPLVLASGFDFYSSPRLSPDGQHLAYLCWRHPNMPWDGCELHLASVARRRRLRILAAQGSS